ncbi:MAG: agmatine deiminase family protein [Myxococcota bacterium]
MVAPPAEWSPHAAVWLAWPSHRELWEHNLEPVQAEFRELCRALIDGGETVRVLVRTDEDARRCAEALGAAATLHSCPYGDIWLRDTGPIFARAEGGLAAHRFRFNGWGEKYRLEGDQSVAPFLAETAGARRIDHLFVLEGGAVEFDGEGTLLTTRSCLLNPNRGPVGSESEATDRLTRALAVERVLWLESGLVNDHTDGHIDTLARFTAPGVVVCMEPNGPDDPNRAVLEMIAFELAAFTDARGRSLAVHTVPSPGRIETDGVVLPASYVNFFIANSAVVVPTYGVDADAEALSRLAELFPGRAVVGCSARTLLEGGGALHCITQQQPET